MKFNVQQIRSCRQCGDVLAPNCEKCKKHPDREPRIIEVYDWPPILKTCECASSVRIACQRLGCGATMWRTRTHTRGGLMRSATMFCSQRCNCLVQNASKRTKVKIPCSWCGKPTLRKPSEVAKVKNIYCRPDHYFLSLRKKAHEAEAGQAVIARALEKLAMLECRGACRAITEHREAGGAWYICNACATRRRVGDTANAIQRH